MKQCNLVSNCERKTMKIFRMFLTTFLFVIVLAACGPKAEGGSDREFILMTEFANGEFAFLGVGGEINGLRNPMLVASPGETITVTLVNGGWGAHDVYFPGLKTGTGKVTEKGETASVTFKVPDEETEIEYHDSVANHAELGMIGVLQVTSQKAAVVGGSLAQAFQKGGCAACHVIPGVPNAVGVLGPDLTDIGISAGERVQSAEYAGIATTAEEYIRESIESPSAFVSPECPNGPCQDGLMPSVAGV
jgi:plastocyanin